MGYVVDETGAYILDELGRRISDGIDAPAPFAEQAATLLAGLPSGRAWPREQDTVLARGVSALGPTYGRIKARATYLLKESPAGDSLEELLPEWEQTLGLPDECSGPQPTLALRQAAVRARLAARGGQSIPYFISVAAALGFDITITEFAPLRFGGLEFGALEFTADSAADTWQVNAPAQPYVPFEFGVGQFGDTFGSIVNNDFLSCTLNRIAPAHTILVITTPAL